MAIARSNSYDPIPMLELTVSHVEAQEYFSG